MTIALLRTLALVTVGTFLAGHGLVRWAAGKAAPVALAPTFAIALGCIATGLAHQADGPAASLLGIAAAVLVLAGVLAVVRRRSRALDER